MSGGQGSIAAFTYAVVSIAIILLNKHVMHGSGWPSAIGMLLTHMIFCQCCLFVLQRLRYLQLKPIDFATIRRVAPLTLCFVGNILVGLASLGSVNVPMFTTLRRLTSVVVLALEFFFLGTAPQTRVMLALSLLVFGAVIAGNGDLHANNLGYIAVMTNNVLTALYMVLSKKLKDKQDIGKFDLLNVNSFLSIPLLFVVMIVVGDHLLIADFLRSPQFHSTFITMFVISAFLAFAINLSMLWCINQNSPLTTTIVGQTKNIVTTALGGLIFSDAAPTPSFVAGISISVCGSVSYSFIKFNQAQQQAKTRKLPESKKPFDLEEQPLIKRRNGIRHAL